MGRDETPNNVNLWYIFRANQLGRTTI